MQRENFSSFLLLWVEVTASLPKSSPLLSTANVKSQPAQGGKEKDGPSTPAPLTHLFSCSLSSSVFRFAFSAPAFGQDSEAGNRGWPWHGDRTLEAFLLVRGFDAVCA